MFKAILAPLDGSALSEQALPTAARLARATGAALHLAHVHVAASLDPISIEGMPVIDEEMRSLAAQHEQVYLERAAAKLAGDGLEPRVARLTGHVVRALTGYAHEIGAGLIVMTSHGRGGFTSLWLGSTAEMLARVSGTPLLLLRPGEGEAGADRIFRRVLVPLDGSPLAEEILPPAAALAAVDGGELELLRVVDTAPAPGLLPFHERSGLDEASLAQMQSEAEAYLEGVAKRLAPVRARATVITADQSARRIIEMAHEGADLVALTTHGRRLTDRFTFGRVTDKVLRAVALPLLILRPGMRHSA